VQGEAVGDAVADVNAKFIVHSAVQFACLRRCFFPDQGNVASSFASDEREMIEISPSTSKSGRSFFLTPDHRFLVKTMTSGEADFLEGSLHQLCQYVLGQPATLLPRFYGLFTTIPEGERATTFLAMSYVFGADDSGNLRRFDLKGSSVGRSTPQTQRVYDKGGVEAMRDVLMDKDLEDSLKLSETWSASLRRQLAVDCDFLETLGIIDYSLVLGISDPPAPDAATPTPASPAAAPSDDFADSLPWMEPARFDDEVTYVEGKVAVLVITEGTETTNSLCRRAVEVTSATVSKTQSLICRRLDASQFPPLLAASLNLRSVPTLLLYDHGDEVARLIGVPDPAALEERLEAFVASQEREAHMCEGEHPWPHQTESAADIVGCATSIFQKDHGGIRGTEGHLYFLGLVDTLTPWSLKKQLEHSVKSLVQSKDDMTIVEPRQYSQRFQRFIASIITWISNLATPALCLTF